MNKNVVFIMLGALVVAVLVAVIVQKNLSPKSNGNKVETLKILVASETISAGEEVTAEKTRWQEWPKEGVFKGAIVKSRQKDPDNLKIYGQKLRRKIGSGEPISTAALIPDSKASSFLAANLGVGMRALSIPVSAATMVGGFVRPGDHIDVILTYQVKLRGETAEYSRSTIQRFASQTILEKTRVLAVDQTAKNAKDEAKVGRTVTLEVTKEGAETLSLAMTMGELSLALRKLGEDEDTVPGGNVQAIGSVGAGGSLTTDVSVSDVLQRVNEIEDRASVTTDTIRIYNGDQMQNITVRTP